MTKVLKVIDPFLRLDFGDMFVQNEDGDYVSSVKEEFVDHTDNGETYSSKYNASFTISNDYATQLVKDGYLEEVSEKKDFVNIFDEIDKLIEQYEVELKDNNDESLHPAIKHEKEVVMTNLLTVLNHLKSLKK